MRNIHPVSKPRHLENLLVGRATRIEGYKKVLPAAINDIWRGMLDENELRLLGMALVAIREERKSNQTEGNESC